MVKIPGGGIIIDMPGVRSVALWDQYEGLDAAFPEISTAAGGCRFRDCGHGDEPGCAVKEAVAAGEIRAERLASYRDLVAEMVQTERRRVERERMLRHRGKGR
jgi:ribosome biogenesis GTPase